VDSEKNIQTHVFPYILGQLSLSEFALLDASVREKRDRVNRLGEELTSYKESFQRTENKITQRIAEIDGLILNEKELPRNFTTMKKLSQLNAEKREANSELFALKIRGRQLEYKIAEPQAIPDGVLRDFEISNLTRLGLAKFLREPFAEPVQIEIPIDPDDHHVSTEAEIFVDYTDSHVITELAEMLIIACSEDWDA
jgi:hypothetical protein